MASRRGKGGRNTRGGQGARGRPQCMNCKRMGHSKKITSLCIAFLTRQLISLKLKFLSPNSLMKRPRIFETNNYNSLTHSLHKPFCNCLHSQYVESQSPWVISSSSFDYIFGNTSMFSYLSSPKNPHLITFA